jgi:hypothetical protein
MTKSHFSTKDVLNAEHAQEKPSGNIRAARRVYLTSMDNVIGALLTLPLN